MQVKVKHYHHKLLGYIVISRKNNKIVELV